MAFDIQSIVSEAVKKLTGDKDLIAEFMKDPVGTLEKKLGIDLPDEQVNAVIDAIKEQLKGEGGKGIIDKIKGLFGM